MYYPFLVVGGGVTSLIETAEFDVLIVSGWSIDLGRVVVLRGSAVELPFYAERSHGLATPDPRLDVVTRFHGLRNRCRFVY